MNLNIKIPIRWVDGVRNFFSNISTERIIAVLAVLLASTATLYFFSRGELVAYGDAESHLNIAKRVIHSITPGFAQLGGIWLPLPHILLIPFVYFDFLWRTGLAGSIVSGICYLIAAIYIYRLSLLLTESRAASFFASLIFMTNLNILYLQSTPMTEVPLLAFFALSSYYFIRFIKNPEEVSVLVLSALFGFAAALTRYDGWFLIGIEMGVIGLIFFPWKAVPRKFNEVIKNFDRERWQKMEGYVILFSTMAFFSIGLWLLWDFLILGDALYFTTSEFSAKSQQNSWFARGELPGYGNVWASFKYYFVTSMSNIGVMVFVLAVAGIALFLSDKKSRGRFYIMLVLLAPFIFNILTMYLGQSVIFIPHITPTTFEWTLFNVRYGVMMIPLAAVATAYLFYRSRIGGKLVIMGLLLFQFALYGVGYSEVISYEDGVRGLSSATSKIPDAQNFLRDNYDGGLILLDDFARVISIVRSPIPMQNVIYVGNKPYYEESLVAPEKYARWIIMQNNDQIWRNIWDKPEIQGRLYANFQRVYTSPEIQIFRRNY